MIQEDVEHKSAVLVIKGAKITGRMLAKAMAATLRQMKKARNTPRHGKQTVKQLRRRFPDCTDIKITDDNIKCFEKYARLHEVDYALKRDSSTNPPTWLVFFSSGSAKDMTNAFAEFSRDILKRETQRPSVRQTMAKFRDIIKNAVIDRTRHKQREGPER